MDDKYDPSFLLRNFVKIVLAFSSLTGFLIIPTGEKTFLLVFSDISSGENVEIKQLYGFSSSSSVRFFGSEIEI